MNDVRPAAVAGSWYPGSPAALERAVREHLQRVPPGEGRAFDRVTAIIAPHAGLMYSGPVAAFAYDAVRPEAFDLVVLVGPSHFVGFDGVSIWPGGAFETPLGRLDIDESCADAILAGVPSVRILPAAHGREHSLEMQLPFIQAVAPGVKIVPLLMGVQSAAAARTLGDGLAASLAGRKAMLVASSDLSHYHDAPTAARMDGVVTDCVGRFDVEGLQRALDQRSDHACGGGPMVAVMRAARALGATDAAVLRYADSGDVSGDKSSVVGYMSAVLGTRGTEKRSGASDRKQTGMNLTTAESRRRILEIAHDAIVDRVRGSRRPTAFVETGLMDEPRGLFVTVRVAGELRGCIGHLEGNRPLPEIVARCAAAACSTDPRFQPLTEAELPRLEVEVSLLGDFEPASGPDEISIGRHGLLVESDSRRGLLLPQVATDWNWDAAEFLAQTCVKAGLPRDAWKKGARIWKFEAEVIGGSHEAG